MIPYIVPRRMKESNAKPRDLPVRSTKKWLQGSCLALTQNAKWKWDMLLHQTPKAGADWKRSSGPLNSALTLQMDSSSRRQHPPAKTPPLQHQRNGRRLQTRHSEKLWSKMAAASGDARDRYPIVAGGCSRRRPRPFLDIKSPPPLHQ